jgi:hypothetical protein
VTKEGNDYLTTQLNLNGSAAPAQHSRLKSNFISGLTMTISTLGSLIEEAEEHINTAEDKIEGMGTTIWKTTVGEATLELSASTRTVRGRSPLISLLPLSRPYWVKNILVNLWISNGHTGHSPIP